MGQESLAVDARFATADARVENAENLLALVEEWMQSFGVTRTSPIFKEWHPGSARLESEEGCVTLTSRSRAWCE